MQSPTIGRSVRIDAGAGCLLIAIGVVHAEAGQLASLYMGAALAIAVTRAPI